MLPSPPKNFDHVPDSFAEFVHRSIISGCAGRCGVSVRCVGFAGRCGGFTGRGGAVASSGRAVASSGGAVLFLNRQVDYRTDQIDRTYRKLSVSTVSSEGHFVEVGFDPERSFILSVEKLHRRLNVSSCGFHDAYGYPKGQNTGPGLA